MPELPEVETTVRGLKKVLSGTFVDVWTDTKKLVKKPESFNSFKKEVKGKKVKGIRRRGKNIIIDLSKGYSLSIIFYQAKWAKALLASAILWVSSLFLTAQPSLLEASIISWASF